MLFLYIIKPTAVVITSVIGNVNQKLSSPKCASTQPSGTKSTIVLRIVSAELLKAEPIA